MTARNTGDNTRSECERLWEQGAQFRRYVGILMLIKDDQGAGTSKLLDGLSLPTRMAVEAEVAARRSGVDARRTPTDRPTAIERAVTKTVAAMRLVGPVTPHNTEASS